MPSKLFYSSSPSACQVKLSAQSRPEFLCFLSEVGSLSRLGLVSFSNPFQQPGGLRNLNRLEKVWFGVVLKTHQLGKDKLAPQKHLGSERLVQVFFAKLISSHYIRLGSVTHQVLKKQQLGWVGKTCFCILLKSYLHPLSVAANPRLQRFYFILQLRHCARPEDIS